MRYFFLLLILLEGLLSAGCTPLGAVSMIGSTINRSVERQQQKQAEEPAMRRVAFSNVNLGIEYMRQGAYEKALEKLNRAREADADYALTYNVLGVLYQLLEQPVDAEKYFKQALKLAPDDSSALNNYGQFLCKQARQDEAEEYFLAAAGNPFYATPEIAYANAGSCAYMHQQREAALAYFEKSLSINPQMPMALSRMAEISFDDADYTRARSYLDRYLAVASHTPKTLWLGIRIERQLGDLDNLASYSLLLRNKYPDTQEAELLRISESLRAEKTNSKTDRQSAAPAKQPRADTLIVTTLPVYRGGLLVEADTSRYPLLLNEKALLGLE